MEYGYRMHYKHVWPHLLLIGSLGLAVFSIVIIHNNTEQLSVVFLDVGQGDSILITTITGKQVLIDGGAYPNVDVAISRHMNFYDRSIDLVIATHPDLDHIGGLVTVLKRYSVLIFLYSGLHSGITAYQQLTHELITSNVSIVTTDVGQTIVLDKDTYLQVLSPYWKSNLKDPNEKSVVIRLVYGDTSVILTGDASVFNEYDMVSVYGNSLSSDVLKLGHHGSKTSSSSLFLDAVQPQYAIVSAGCDNRFGHPHQEVVERISSRRVELLDTCSRGDIVFYSDGREWKLK